MTASPIDFIHRNAPLFARVGSVVATYRTRGTTRFGPYYRLIYRQDRRQRSLYLGHAEQLADQVRELLAELQTPRDRCRDIRRSHQLRKATLLKVKRHWQQVIRAYGLRPHGWDVRGLRALGWPRIDKVNFREKKQPALRPTTIKPALPSPPTVTPPTTLRPLSPRLANIVQTTITLPNSTFDIVQTTIALPNSTFNIDQTTVALPNSTFDIDQTAIALPNSTCDIDQTTIALPNSCTVDSPAP